MNLAPNEKPSNLIENLIEEGIVELKIYNTIPEHAKEYGLDSVNPLYVQSIYVSDNSRLKGIGKKVLAYIDKYAIKNGHDVIFGHITQKAKFTKDKRETFFSDIDMIKNWLHSNSYAINQNNNDFYKVVNTTFDSSSHDIRFEQGGGIDEISKIKLEIMRLQIKAFKMFPQSQKQKQVRMV
jgi:GNAT superfamily N-acetyltransferase